ERTVSDWIFERRNLTHLFAVERQMKDLPLEKEESLTALDTLYWVYENHGHYRKAEEICMAVLATREKLLGTNHLETLNTIYDMAGLYQRQGKYNQALGLYQRVLEGGEKVLGTDHQNTLGTVIDMGLREKKRHWVLTIQPPLILSTTWQITDHPSTLDTVNSMANVYESQGKYSQALELYQRALAGREKALGADHPNTLGTIYNMAIVYQSQGKYSQALELYQRALAGKEKALGANHPSTLDTVYSMAILYEDQREYSQAMELFQRALAGREKTLGAEHSDTVLEYEGVSESHYGLGKVFCGLLL
ncbi:hypothetical protein BDZ91DRAFT_755540, partial [Kalaharituber pfeilii]